MRVPRRRVGTSAVRRLRPARSCGRASAWVGRALGHRHGGRAQGAPFRTRVTREAPHLPVIHRGGPRCDRVVFDAGAPRRRTARSSARASFGARCAPPGNQPYRHQASHRRRAGAACDSGLIARQALPRDCGRNAEMRDRGVCLEIVVDPRDDHAPDSTTVLRARVRRTLTRGRAHRAACGSACGAAERTCASREREASFGDAARALKAHSALRRSRARAASGSGRTRDMLAARAETAIRTVLLLGRARALASHILADVSHSGHGTSARWQAAVRLHGQGPC